VVDEADGVSDGGEPRDGPPEATRQPARTSHAGAQAVPRRRVLTVARMPSPLAALVLAVLAALSVVAWWVVRNGVDRQDQELLREGTSQAVLRLQTNVEHISLGLGSVGVEAQVFEKQARAIISGSTTTVALVSKGTVVGPRGQIAPGPPQVAVAVGPAVHDGEQLTGELAQIALAAQSTLSASPVTRLAGNRCVVFSIVPPSIGLPGYVALQVNEIVAGRSAGASDGGVGLDQISSPNGPFHQLDFAVYATPTPQPSELLASTIGRLPTHTALAELRVGSVEWDVVGAAKVPLLDEAARATPWIVLGVGLVLALGLAVTVDTLTRRQRQQRTVAEALQAALLPETLPQLGATEAAVRYLPGVEGIHVGGDWYDLIALDDTHLLAVVGDVSGRGLQAAAVMAMLLYGTRAYAAEGDAPEAIVGKLSGLLSVGRSGRFATILLILIDLDRQSITVVNGGHPPPLLLRDRQAEYIDAPTGLPVGVVATEAYTPVTVPVSPGTTLLAFTDGLIERRGESLDVGLGRLRQAAIANGNGSLEALVSSVVGTLVGKGAADDTVLLGVRWRAEPIQPAAEGI
jgi:membrane protein implicated in regulation of membrane protease activity